MIVSDTFYGVKCNRCLELFEDGEHSFWTDEYGAVENAIDSEWMEQNGKHYCTECYEIDEITEENKVRDDYPIHIKTLRNFIKKVLFGSLSLIESDIEFIFSFYLNKIEKLADFDENYIRELTGEKFVSFEYIKEKYHSNKLIITINK